MNREEEVDDNASTTEGQETSTTEGPDTTEVRDEPYSALTSVQGWKSETLTKQNSV